MDHRSPHSVGELARNWARLIVRAWFTDSRDAVQVRDQLTTRGYKTQFLTSSDGTALLTVSTPRLLRAEVDGLIWLGGGQSSPIDGTQRVAGDASPEMRMRDHR